MGVLVVIMLSLWLFLTVGASAPEQNAPPKPPCVALEFAQFDFWVGEWDVFDTTGKQVGSNSVTRTLDGCLIREEWRGLGGARGGSWNVYQKGDGQWHQVWIDTSGAMLHLHGRLETNAMRMSDRPDRADKPGTAPINRISWTPNADGSVRQVWEVSVDAGKSWKVAFDGRYTRKRVQ